MTQHQREHEREHEKAAWAAWIAYVRKSHNLTQEQFGKALGWRKSRVTQIESLHRPVRTYEVSQVFRQYPRSVLFVLVVTRTADYTVRLAPEDPPDGKISRQVFHTLAEDLAA